MKLEPNHNGLCDVFLSTPEKCNCGLDTLRADNQTMRRMILDCDPCRVLKLEEALAVAESALEVEGCDCGHDDPPCALCEVQAALATKAPRG